MNNPNSRILSNVDIMDVAWDLLQSPNEAGLEGVIGLLDKARAIRDKEIRLSIIGPLCEYFVENNIQLALPPMRKR